MPKRSQTERALQAVKRRKDDYKAKRFNGPLNIFIKRKYPKIFDEYTNLFNFIDLSNPGKKKLLKTLTFKQWMKDNPEPLKNLTPTSVSCEISSVNCETTTTTCDETPPSVSEMPSVNCEMPSVNSEKSSVKRETTTASANHEVATSANRETISNILDDLFGPDGIPDDVLSSEDEGINLNRFEEIAFDYEPFDFLNETKGF